MAVPSGSSMAEVHSVPNFLASANTGRSLTHRKERGTRGVTHLLTSGVASGSRHERKLGNGLPACSHAGPFARPSAPRIRGVAMPETLRTQRLALRLLGPDDIDTVHALFSCDAKGCLA